MPPNTDDLNHEPSFASLLNDYEPRADHHLQVGDKVQGKIIAVSHDTVFVDIGAKIDGILDKAELLDKQQDFPYQIGDDLSLYIIALGEQEIKLSQAISGVGGIHLLRDAYHKSIPVEGRIIETCKGGFQVEVLQRRAFCPISQVDIAYVENPEDYLGANHRFLVTTFDQGGRNIVLSRRALLDRELEKSRQQFLETLSVDDVLEGTVSKIAPYGAFVRLSAGLEGMVHASELSWSRNVVPQHIVQVGDALHVKVIGIETDPKSSRPKIALSVKQLSADPWIHIQTTFQEGQIVRGTVTQCAKFGAFVEISPGIEGLVHISEMSYLKRVLKPEDEVSPGDAINVLIKEIDPQKRRIALSLRDAEGDPWTEVGDKFSVGQAVRGTVEKVEKFGCFIRLAPGITGLLPKSKIRQSQHSVQLEKLKEGETLIVMVEALNTRERKITLTPGDSGDEMQWRKFAADNAQPAMSSFAEKLEHALASKKKASE